MLWIILDGRSYAITSCNVYKREDNYELWVERANGKTLKIKESDNKDEIYELKDALDFAVKHDKRTFEIS